MNQVSGLANTAKTARGKNTRKKLLRAAETEFAENGFHATSISAITARAGVALGTFYVHFKNKQQIFCATVSYVGQRMRRWITKRVADVPEGSRLERSGFAAVIEFIREHQGIRRIIAEAEWVANGAFREHYARFAEAYRENLIIAGKKGDIREGDYRVWSWAIMGMSEFTGMRFVNRDEVKSTSAVTECMADLVANGIGPDNIRG